MTFSELGNIENSKEKTIRSNGKSFILTTWIDKINDDEIRIVVQSYRHFFLGIGKMDANGFTINKKGEISDLSESDLYEFI